MKKEVTKKAVREGYARIVAQDESCCGPVSACCGDTEAEAISKKIGYTEEELDAIPEGANLGLGCGNPVAVASLKEGETVLDLGSGAGMDCFLAAKKVGKTGKVIGVDMTPEMLDKARKNARKSGYENVEFRLGEIENLPVADNSVDVVISNCVINLSPEKPQVFRETFRVLKPGGRLMISDIVVLKELPEALRNSVEAYVGCLAGAVTKEEYLGAIKDAGFRDIQIIDETSMPAEAWVSEPIADSVIKSLNITIDEVKDILGSVSSIRVRAVKLD